MFIPQATNASDVCSPLIELRATLPVSSERFRNGNLAGFILFIIVFFVLTTPVLYAFREHPRFSKVRPFWVIEFMMICGTLIGAATFLRLWDEESFPCAATVVLWLFGMQGLGGVLIVRSLIFVVEREVQRKLRVRSLELDKEVVDPKPPSVSAVKQILGVGLGLVNIDDVELDTLAQVKQPGFLAVMVCAVMTPPFLAFVVLFASYPMLAHCRGCYAFTEILIAMIVCSIPNILVIFRIVFVGFRRHRERDAHGVVTEFVIVCALVLPLVVISLVLEIVDPGEVDIDYWFAWEWLLMLSGGIFYIASVFVQLIRAIQQTTKERRVYSSSKNEPNQQLSEKSMLNVIKNETSDIGKEFESFAMKDFVVELVHFVRDVRSFKEYFPDKGDTWRLQKAKLLISTYFKLGAAAEINISDSIRKTVLANFKRIESASSVDTNTLFTIFDDAVIEVTTMLHHGVWMRFVLMKQGKDRTLSGFVSSRESIMPSRIAPSAGAQSDESG